MPPPEMLNSDRHSGTKASNQEGEHHEHQPCTHPVSQTPLAVCSLASCFVDILWVVSASQGNKLLFRVKRILEMIHLNSIASSCFQMSGTACDAKAGTKEAVANLEPVHSETMCILPLTRCAEDAFTDALHVFCKRSEVRISGSKLLAENYFLSGSLICSSPALQVSKSSGLQLSRSSDLQVFRSPGL